MTPKLISKYQFNIFEYNVKTNNAAATKAVLDCNTLYTQQGYINNVLTFSNNSKRGLAFYLTAFAGICRFLLKAKAGSLVGTQYPMLNNVFKYFIIAARLKKIKFFCVIHDVESLRLGGKDKALVIKETANLNYYNCLIVHNTRMMTWLQVNGVTTKMVSLGIFDYLTESNEQNTQEFSSRIVYAGNLGKSQFVYLLNNISKWKFNLYGPNYQNIQVGENVNYCGVFSPNEVVNELKGDFGLIWDGDYIDKTDDVLGNYLKYNNPHKFSLYLAAGLPVIAPASAAIADIIKQHNVGLLINNLTDLQNIVVTTEEFNTMKRNVAGLREKISNGDFFLTALKSVEKELLN